MLRPHPARPAAALATLAAATLAAATLAAATLAAAVATPAQAQAAGVPAGPDTAGAATASALTLTLNLPGGAATQVVLQLDPVTGTASAVRSTLAAKADATVLRGMLGGQAMDSGASSAMLPAPLESSAEPSGELAEGLAGTPLADLLTVDLVPSSAAVTAGPTSTSTAAVASLGAGLPDALADALVPLTTPLRTAVDDVLTALATASGTPVAQLCAGATDAVEALDPVTSGLTDALSALPVPVPVQGLRDRTVIMAVCGLSTTITGLDVALQGALSSLTGATGVLGTGKVSSEQRVDRAGNTVSSVATASVAGLTLLGQTPFAKATALSTRSTATAAGSPGSARASVDTTLADRAGGAIDPFLQVRTTVQGVRDGIVGAGTLPEELEGLLASVFDRLNAALGPVGVTVLSLDDAARATPLTGCPSGLDGLQTGTVAAADGGCAAAASRGVGIAVTLPEALATALMISGPLVELQIAPTAALAEVRLPASSSTAPVAPAAAVAATTLPRTGPDGGLLGGTGLLLLLGAAVMARRRPGAPV